MSRKTETKTPNKVSEVLYNYHQISIVLKLSDRDRRVVQMKYGDVDKTQKEWEKLLKKNGFKF